MQLEQLEKLTKSERLALPQAEIDSAARAAASELISQGHWNAESVYVGDRFGEKLLWVYIPDETFSTPYPNREYAYYGFRVFFQPVSKKLPGLEQYKGEWYFQR